MQEVLVSELKPHPQNDFYFDDMEGSKWKEFLESIKKRGVIEPIIATTDMVIVSGHQRIRACKELGIKKVKVEFRHYNNDDEIVQDLLETNIRQRGTIGGSSVKLGRRIKKLEELYEIQHGGDRKSEKIKSANCGFEKYPHTQEELATILNISVDTLDRAKKLVSLPPEIQEFVENGKLSQSTAVQLIARLSEEEQEQLIADLPISKKLTAKQVQEYIDKLKSAEKRHNTVKLEMETKISELNKKLSERQEPQYIEVAPADYEDLKRENDAKRQDYDSLRRVNEDLVKDKRNLENTIASMQSTPEEDIERKAKLNALRLRNAIDDFLTEYGGVAYVIDDFVYLTEFEKKAFIEGVQNICAWGQNIIVSYQEKENG